VSRGRPLRDVSQFGVTIPGFTIWFDRWNGHGWCWRELPGSPFSQGDDDVTEGRNLRSKMAARGAIREEIMRRQHKTASAHGR
jgi:hypothetical protein